MTSEKGLKMTPREIVRTHAYPVLAAVSTPTLVIAALSVVEASKSLKESSKSLEEVSKSLYPIFTFRTNLSHCKIFRL